MVLKLNNENVFTVDSLARLHKEYPTIVKQADDFKELDTVNLGEINSLYIGQGEYAVIPGYVEQPVAIGSDDATTCHIAIFHNVATNTCAVAHLDNRSGQEASLIDIIHEIEDLDGNLSDVDIFVIGGYSSLMPSETKDSNNCSEDISLKVLHFLRNSTITFNIKLFCTCALNTKNNAAKPIFTGLAIDRRKTDIFPAHFTSRCPASTLRSAYFWVDGCDSLVNIYDHQLQAVVVRPYHGWEQEKYAYLSTLSDSRLLKYFSTSPLVEPPSFCQRLRETFSLLGSNSSIFDKDSKKYFKLNIEGQWEESNNHHQS